MTTSKSATELKLDRASYQQQHSLAPRSSMAEAALILSEIVVLSAFMLLSRAISTWTVFALALSTLLAIAFRFIQALHLSLFFLLWVAPPFALPALNYWPQILLVPLIVYGLILVTIESLRHSVRWLRVGHLNSRVVILILLTIVVSSGALIGWYFLLKPDIGSHLAMIPKMPAWLVPIAGLSFALLNAAMEETVFRGIIMQALDSALGYDNLTVVIQAVSFAAFHYLDGFPNGAWGFAMVFVYGVMLGLLRRYSKGLLAPWLAHVLADVTIFSVLATTLS